MNFFKIKKCIDGEKNIDNLIDGDAHIVALKD